MVMLGLVEYLVAHNVPLDGVGFQGHVYQMPRDNVDPDILDQIVTRIQQLGLKINLRILEMDDTGADPVAQAKQYSAVLAWCLKNGVDFTTWGLTDRYGSTASVNNNGILVPGDNLPWIADYRPKPAEIAMRQVLKS